MIYITDVSATTQEQDQRLFLSYHTYSDALYISAVVTAQAVVMTTGAPQPISV
jgi:hypothetical protein